MNRVVLALLCLLMGCHRGSDAVQVLVHVDPDVKASCIAVEVLDSSGVLMSRELVARPPGREQWVVAVFQKNLPQDIQVWARALFHVGETGDSEDLGSCDEPLVRNGRGEPGAVRFDPKQVTSITIEMPKPTSTQDRDGDGFVNRDAEGEDCADAEALRHPGAAEVCDASADRNCNDQRGCADDTCSTQACAYLPVSLAFTVSSSQARVGECAAVSVVRRDTLGHPTAPGFDTPVSVASEFPSELSLYSDSKCMSGLGSSVTIASGRDSATFYVKGLRMKSGKLAVSSTEYGTASVTHTINPSPPTKLVFVAKAGPSLKAAECSSVVTVRAQDDYNNASPVTADTLLTLSSTAGKAVAFFTDADCKSPTATVSIPAGGSEVSFRVKGLAGGPTVMLSAAAAGLSAATQSVSVASAVRRGSCVLPASSSMTGLIVNCPVSPAVDSVDRSFVSFQVTSSDPGAGPVFMRCGLSSTSNIMCGRNYPGGQVNINWQVVEMASGLRVQHFNKDCTGPKTVIPIEAVDPSKTFLLFSSGQFGAHTEANDFATAVLKSPTEVEVTLNAAACDSLVYNGTTYYNGYALEVVEMDGLMVSRGTTDAFEGTLKDVTVPSATAARSLVLSTHQSRQPDGTPAFNAICNRVMRGEVTSDTTLRFYRGFGFCDPGGLISTISWERITAVSKASVQLVQLIVNTGYVADVRALNSAVDPNRTLLLSSSQAYGGQSGGETNYPTDDIPGVAAGRFQLVAPGYDKVELVRDTTKGDSKWTVYALQFEP